MYINLGRETILYVVYFQLSTTVLTLIVEAQILCTNSCSAQKHSGIAGDRLEIEFAMRITTEQIVDWHPEYRNLKVS